MARVGYRGITIPERVYSKLEVIAKAENYTIPRIIENLVNARMKRKTGGQ